MKTHYISKYRFHLIGMVNGNPKVIARYDNAKYALECFNEDSNGVDDPILLFNNDNSNIAMAEYNHRMSSCC